MDYLQKIPFLLAPKGYDHTLKKPNYFTKLITIQAIILKNKPYTIHYKQTLLLLLSSVTLMAESHFHPLMSNKSSITQQLPSKNQLIVAYYGRPGTSKLGILGKYTIPTLITKVKAKAAQYAKVAKNSHVTPALELVHSMATVHPGAYKDYIIPLSEKRTLRYIHAAQAEGMAVFLDHQLGKKTPLQAIRSMLKYLQYHNVHLAIDPEFAVHGRKVRPGKVIGTITGEDVNRVQAAMSHYMQTHGITETKILLLHMFRHRMLKHKSSIRYYPNIKLVMHLDGHGPSAVKVNIYNSIYTPRLAEHFAGGFKLFFQRDKPRLMTPKQVMGLAPTQRRKINHPPQFISYQ